ncbi:hypothetical protein [Gluconobacter sp. P1D12_c]|uniref:hypothetical protein n=1 Tax=Gluconobacter TaxID=441 RepID=UPI001C05E539|nr:hypothetical protein [Gluconobacter sp. P1D12_c]
MRNNIPDSDKILTFGVSLYSDTAGLSDSFSPPDGPVDLGSPDSGSSNAPQIQFAQAYSPGNTMVMEVGFMYTDATYSNKPGVSTPQNVYFDGQLIDDKMNYSESSGKSTETIVIPIPDGNYNGNQLTGVSVVGYIQGNSDSFSWGFSDLGHAVQAYAQDLATFSANSLHSQYAGSTSDLYTLSQSVANSWSLLQHKW